MMIGTVVEGPVEIRRWLLPHVVGDGGVFGPGGVDRFGVC